MRGNFKLHFPSLLHFCPFTPVCPSTTLPLIRKILTMITINVRVRAILLVIVSIACTTNGQFLPSFEPRTIRPVIIVPGLEGSQLEVKLNKPSVVQSNCDRRTDDFSTIWVDITEMTPAKIDCFLDNMKLVYNSTTRKTSNAPGVETRSPGWGQTWAVEYMSRTLQIPQRN